MDCWPADRSTPPILRALLDQQLNIDPEQPLEDWLPAIPAAWCVYLLADADGRPVQLLCVKNLRASLKRRLGGGEVEDALPSRRIDYRALVRRVCWSRVDSALEQDFVYLETARHAFPETYAGVLGFRSAWWVTVDPAAEHPRFMRTTEPSLSVGRCFGPLPEKNAAQKLVHLVEDLFDLCRDPAALANAPAAPCQWRQMNKCVGPCDGSVGLPAYRALCDHAADVLADPASAVADHHLRMRQAAAATQFETAGAIKAFADKLETLTSGPYRHLRPLEQFRFLAVLPGGRKESAKLLVITPGVIRPLACLREPPTKRRGEEVLRSALALLAEPAEPVDSAAARERLSLITHHLFPSRKTPGVLIPVEQVEDRSLAAAFREVNRPLRAPETDPEDEGEVRGLQSL